MMKSTFFSWKLITKACFVFLGLLAGVNLSYGQILTGDNLGNHTATTNLNMNSKNFLNIGSVQYFVQAITNLNAGGNIAASVANNSVFAVNQTTAGQTLTLPAATTAGQIVYVINKGTAAFTLYGITVNSGSMVELIYNGAAWSSSASTLAVSTPVTATDANGAVISGNSFVLEYANGTSPGIVSTAAQSFAGAKTFSSDVVATRYLTTMPAAITAAATTTIDLSTGNVFAINVGANITTLTLTNAPTRPATFMFKLIYSSAIAYTITWPATFLWSGGTSPILTCATGKTDIFTVLFDGTNYYCSYALNF